MTEQQASGAVETVVVRPLRILYFDVETSPMLAYIWSAKQDFVPYQQVIRDSHLFCWAAKWSDESTVKSAKLNATELREHDDRRIAEELASLIREADLVVAHNGDRFDLPVLRARLLANGAEPLGPVDSIDTLKLARKSFKLSHSNLDNLGRRLGLGEKIKTDFDLWESVYNGDEVALQKMVRYCRNDVVLLERVFDRMRSHVSGLRRLVDGEGAFCPYCGSTKYEKRGVRRTNAGNQQRFRCLECGRYFHDKTSDAAKRQMRPTP